MANLHHLLKMESASRDAIRYGKGFQWRKSSANPLSSTLLLLEQVFSPASTHFRALQDPVIVSLHLEYDSTLSPPQISQIGLSVLDTRNLANSKLKDIQSIRPSVSSHLFLLRSGHHGTYCYGDPQFVEGKSPKEILRPFLAMKDNKGRSRNVVLVGHSIHNDLSVLEKCGLDLNRAPQVKSIVDIAPLAAQILRYSKQWLPLKHLCNGLRIRTCSSHNAAHDALYTLQTLSHLFCLYKMKDLEPLDGVSSPDEKEMEQILLWDPRLIVLDFVGDELGNVLWLGTPAARQRRQRREEHALGLQLGPVLKADEFELSNVRAEDSTLNTLPIGDLFDQ